MESPGKPERLVGRRHTLASPGTLRRVDFSPKRLSEAPSPTRPAKAPVGSPPSAAWSKSPPSAPPRSPASARRSPPAVPPAVSPPVLSTARQDQVPGADRSVRDSLTPSKFPRAYADGGEAPVEGGLYSPTKTWIAHQVARRASRRWIPPPPSAERFGAERVAASMSLGGVEAPWPNQREWNPETQVPTIRDDMERDRLGRPPPRGTVMLSAPSPSRQMEILGLRSWLDRPKEVPMADETDTMAAYRRMTLKSPHAAGGLSPGELLLSRVSDGGVSSTLNEEQRQYAVRRMSEMVASSYRERRARLSLATIAQARRRQAPPQEPVTSPLNTLWKDSLRSTVEDEAPPTTTTKQQRFSGYVGLIDASMGVEEGEEEEKQPPVEDQEEQRSTHREDEEEQSPVADEEEHLDRLVTPSRDQEPAFSTDRPHRSIQMTSIPVSPSCPRLGYRLPSPEPSSSPDPRGSPPESAKRARESARVARETASRIAHRGGSASSWIDVSSYMGRSPSSRIDVSSYMGRSPSSRIDAVSHVRKSPVSLANASSPAQVALSFSTPSSGPGRTKPLDVRPSLTPAMA
jgi:hypothetical protein